MKMFVNLICFFSVLVNGGYSYELGIVSMFRNEGPYIKEWVEYHRLAGVEHFWLYDNGSEDSFKEALQPYVDSGLVEIIDWPSPFEYGTQSHGPLQVEAFKDGLRRALNNTTWIALIDIDEFLVPMQDSSITECLNKRLSNADGIYINWRNFGTSGITVPLGDPFLLQLTQCSFKGHPRNCIGKSIVRPDKVNIDKFCYVHYAPLKPNCHYLNGIGKPVKIENDMIFSDGQHYDKYIRINHYALRDEYYYHNVRLKRRNYGYGGNELLKEHYESFNAMKDFALVNYLYKYHKDAFLNFWKGKVK